MCRDGEDAGFASCGRQAGKMADCGSEREEGIGERLRVGRGGVDVDGEGA